MELLNAGYEVVVLDNLYNSSEEALGRVEQITGKSVKFFHERTCWIRSRCRIEILTMRRSSR